MGEGRTTRVKFPITPLHDQSSETVADVGTLGTLTLGGEEGVREDYRDGDQ
jgi:hypothetical protein